jgi:hypothetical protein
MPDRSSRTPVSINIGTASKLYFMTVPSKFSGTAPMLKPADIIVSMALSPRAAKIGIPVTRSTKNEMNRRVGSTSDL